MRVVGYLVSTVVVCWLLILRRSRLVRGVVRHPIVDGFRTKVELEELPQDEHAVFVHLALPQDPLRNKEQSETGM